MKDACDQVTIWTIGHSNHKVQAFRELLDRHGIKTLIDIRTKPASRFCPQFNKAALSRSMQEAGIEYKHMAELGGLHAGAGQGEGFEIALRELVALAKGERAAIMCSEGDPQQCHREYLVGASLRRSGHRVIHILKDGESVESGSEKASSSDRANTRADRETRTGQLALFTNQNSEQLEVQNER